MLKFEIGYDTIEKKSSFIRHVRLNEISFVKNKNHEAMLREVECCQCKNYISASYDKTAQVCDWYCAGCSATVKFLNFAPSIEFSRLRIVRKDGSLFFEDEARHDK